MKKIILLSSLAVLTPHYAEAAYKVYSPRVEKGVVEIENKNTFDFDTVDSRQHVLEVGYGLTDWMSISLEGELEKEGSRGYEYTATAIETIFQFTQSGEYWLDVGAKFEAERSHETQHADKIEGSLLLEKGYGRFVHTANVNFEREVGHLHENGVEYGLSWRSKYLYSPMFNPGVEYYGEYGHINDPHDFDDQDNRLGPVISGDLGHGFSYDLGWLIGLSDGASDHTLKLNLEYEFLL